MRIGKRIVACGMCLSMVLGMVACGGEEGNKETSGSSNATVNETVANKPTESTTKAELYSPTEEIMSAKMGEGKVQLFLSSLFKNIFKYLLPFYHTYANIYLKKFLNRCII